MVNLNYVSKDQFYNSKIYSFLFGTLILCNTLLTSSVVEHGKEKKKDNTHFEIFSVTFSERSNKQSIRIRNSILFGLEPIREAGTEE